MKGKFMEEVRQRDFFWLRDRTPLC